MPIRATHYCCNGYRLPSERQPEAARRISWNGMLGNAGFGGHMAELDHGILLVRLVRAAAIVAAVVIVDTACVIVKARC
jgi:hypothetical protein